MENPGHHGHLGQGTQVYRPGTGHGTASALTRWGEKGLVCGLPPRGPSTGHVAGLPTSAGSGGSEPRPAQRPQEVRLLSVGGARPLDRGRP